MKKRAVTVAVAMLLAGVSAGAGPAAASGKPPEHLQHLPASAQPYVEMTESCTSVLNEDVDSGTDRLAQAVHALQTEGASEEEIAEHLATQYCIVPLDNPAEPVISPLAVEDEITIHRPTVGVDAVSGVYTARAQWTWKKLPRNVSGRDGFGIRFSTTVNHLSHRLMVSGRNQSTYPPKTYRQAETSGPAGVGFIFHEGPRNTYTKDMQGWNGTQLISFLGTGKCKSLQAFSQYRHTWNSTSVTGISISTNSIAISFGGGTSTWAQASTGSASRQVCP